MVTTEQIVDSINFWIAQLNDHERALFFEWWCAHAAAVGLPDHGFRGDRLSGSFQKWLDTLPPEERKRESLVVLGEVCWQGFRIWRNT